VSPPNPSSLLRSGRQILLLTSTLLFATFTVVFTRAQFTSDDLTLLRWNPATRTYSETHIRIRANGLSLHTESTTATPSDNTSTITASLAPSNLRLTHFTWPVAPRDASPLLWADHYRTTPTIGINPTGLSNCYTLQFRHELPLILSAIFPAIWLYKTLKRRLIRRPPAGFPLDAQPPIEKS
jgi:hypothetical protein